MFEPLEGPVRLFARAGASVNEEPHSIESFQLGLRLGASGLQGDVWPTSDRQAVLSQVGHVGSRFRKRRISDLSSTDVGTSRMLLRRFYGELGSDFDLMLNVRDSAALESVIEPAMEAAALDRLWIMSPDVDLLGSWRSRLPEARLVHSTRVGELSRGLEQHAALLRKYAVDAVSLRFDEWTAGNVTLFHRFTRLVVAWDPQHERQMRDLMAMGVDVMVSDQVERMADVTGP